MIRFLSSIAGPRRSSSPVLHPDRIRDLDSIGWVCTADRLHRDTEWRPQFDLATGMRDTLASYRSWTWVVLNFIFNPKMSPFSRITHPSTSRKREQPRAEPA